MKFNQLDIITKFTLTFGVSGMVATCIGIGANIAGATTFINPYFKKTPTLETCIKNVFYTGNILIGSGLILVGGSVAIAKYAGENLPASYFNEDGEKYLSKTYKCQDCKYFHGHQYNDVDFICAVHSSGVEESICFDKELLPQKLTNIN